MDDKPNEEMLEYYGGDYSNNIGKSPASAEELLEMREKELEILEKEKNELTALVETQRLEIDDLTKKLGKYPDIAGTSYPKLESYFRRPYGYYGGYYSGNCKGLI